MNKKQLIDAVAEESGFTKKDTALFIDTLTKTVAGSLASGEKVALVGFGTFETVKRNERKCRNLQTGEDMVVPAKMAPKFRPSKSLKETVGELEVAE